MNKRKKETTDLPASNGHVPKRVVFTMGGKGGTGKTTFMTSLCEYYNRIGVPYDLLDLDMENKLHGSLSHFFPRAKKLDPTTETGLDFYLDILRSDIDVLLADQGAGQGALTYKWFDTIYDELRHLGYPLHFTAVGVVTYDPATVESVLSWASHLGDRVDYLLVKNSLREGSGFPGLELEPAARFLKRFQPAIVDMSLRVAEYEQAARLHGLTPGAVAEGKVEVQELRGLGIKIRAATYRRNLENQLAEHPTVLLAPSVTAS
jgi:hypothetical protein